MSKKCLWKECHHSFVFLGGQFVQFKVCFCKGYLSSSSYNHRKDWVFVHHAEVAFWSVYLCTMRGCFWSVYLCTMLRLLFDLCILLFDLCTLLEEGTDVKFCWPSSTLVCVCAKVGCLWLCQSMHNFGINHKQSEHKLWHKPETKWAPTFCERWQWHWGHNFRISHFSEFFSCSLFSSNYYYSVWIILVCFLSNYCFSKMG